MNNEPIIHNDEDDYKAAFCICKECEEFYEEDSEAEDFDPRELFSGDEVFEMAQKMGYVLGPKGWIHTTQQHQAEREEN